PRISLEPDKLLDIAIENDVLLGPAHVFTPYFGIYSHYDTLKEAYGRNYKKIKFIELGLSADTKTANTIPELKDIKFFSFSDSHSPKSFRIGREYVSMELEKPNYNSLEKLLNNHKKNYILENVGYNPYEGKYNSSACKKCAQIYTLEQAEVINWKCQVCKGTIKKGVTDRAKEISIIQGNKNLKEITKRPNYRYLIPLAQVIQIAINQKNILHKTVLEKYDEFTKNHTEIQIMQEVSKEELEKIDKNIARYIIAFRKDFVVFRPGGAGHYGVPYICFSKEEKIKKEKEIQEEIKVKVLQKKLF
ncbi:MAG: phosphotransferase, partial [Candidatus ainarchaeum sp.]|nr:phosphotransferase [Candidatus ainarchaeum sp.]